MWTRDKERKKCEIRTLAVGQKSQRERICERARTRVSKERERVRKQPASKVCSLSVHFRQTKFSSEIRKTWKRRGSSIGSVRKGDWRKSQALRGRALEDSENAFLQQARTYPAYIHISLFKATLTKVHFPLTILLAHAHSHTPRHSRHLDALFSLSHFFPGWSQLKVNRLLWFLISSVELCRYQMRDTLLLLFSFCFISGSCGS